MEGGFAGVTRQQLYTGELVAIIVRFLFLVGLSILYITGSASRELTDPRTITVAVLVVLTTAYSIASLQLLARSAFPALLAHVSTAVDVACAGVFLAFALHPSGGPLGSTFVATAGLFFPGTVILSLLRFLPLNVALAGGSATLVSLLIVLAALVLEPGSGAPAVLLLVPGSSFLVGAVCWVVALVNYRLLERNLATEDLQRASRRLRMTFEIVQASIFNLSQFVDNLGRISGTLSEGARNQARSIDRISAAIAAMNASQEQIYRSTEISAKTVRQTVDSSDHGNQVVKKVIEEIRSISDVVERMVAALQLIDDIADNTNLLALNANLEANRGGPERMGFSVVADEIRNLAEQSQETANEVGRLVKQIAKVIYTADSSSRNAGEIFDKINTDLSGYSQYVRNLHLSVQEQLKANRDVERSITRINDVTVENTEAADRVREVVGELQKEVAKLRGLVDGKITETAGLR